RSVLLAALAASLACDDGGDNGSTTNSSTTTGDTTTGGDGPAPTDRCPSWEPTVVVASGTFDIHAVGGALPASDAWRVGVEAFSEAYVVESARVAAGVVELAPLTEGAAPSWPWERWVFSATWRFAGPIDSSTKIDGATLTGTPGMSGGVSEREVACAADGC